MNIKAKLSLVTLGVADLERSRLFYEELGWTSPDWQPGSEVVFIPLDGVILGLFARDDLARDMGVEISLFDGHSALTLAHNEPSPDDVDRAFETFLAAGASLIKRPMSTPWGGYSGYVADPDDHVWEIAYNPFSDWT